MGGWCELGKVWCNCAVKVAHLGCAGREGLDTSRIRTIPPGLGLRVLGSGRGQGQQALGRCWALKGVERETLAPAEPNLGPADSPGPGSL